MFGWTLIRKERLKYLEDCELRVSCLSQVHRWFSGWTDLDIIWDWVFSRRDFGGISGARTAYARARGTTEYGGPLGAASDKGQE